jgi:hypothetical protein
MQYRVKIILDNGHFSDTLEAKSLKHLWIQIHKVILHSIAHFQHVSGVNIERIK